MIRFLWLVPYIGIAAFAHPLELWRYVGMILCVAATMIIYRYAE